MSSPDTAATVLQENAALWSAREIHAEELVRVACDALLADLDSPTLRVLAACTRAEAGESVPALLPAALDELGLVFYPLDSEAGRVAVARILAQRVLAGELTAREFARRIHLAHGHELELTELVAGLDDQYTTVGYGVSTPDEAWIDAEVIAEASRIAAYPHEPIESASTSD
ncbi:hypothetical protein SAMN04487820_11082 [Actinopolyspora mzabensis]|uniref:Uncharacterized protein n=1 Tax=Actinopolyspora mzabensis TaxID=995066 RepID=A0A1G9DGV2_ACTMZ|nr:hypothetical protein [Actinopolyspora mzabensis]SDK63014.1 hypothetical protein SAMN04487820_11082 [Actinopolyspora mzabensis]